MVEFLSSILASKSLAHFNTSIDPRQTHAIMDNHHIFEPTSTLLRLNSSRSVLIGKDGTPFVSLWCDQRHRNWLSPLLARKLGELDFSGMAGRWDDLQRVTDVQLILKLIRDPAYKRYVKGFRPNRKSAKEVPIQLKEVKSIFILSSFLFLLALTSFGVEAGHVNRTKKAHWNGYKADIKPNKCINSYIRKKLKAIGNRSDDGAPQFRSPAKNIYAGESDKWDILYV
ncbi:hypothetical protein Fcan01_27920 [Folsomia candida]|uniref:Uncharacterized protein n=1 Tax=Folsomia candida TaxID=158441 RepID=A0A226CWI0_FOLCA|nr:hypothetical protein Fcan01_27920 [Folsomia candida]